MRYETEQRLRAVQKLEQSFFSERVGQGWAKNLSWSNEDRSRRRRVEQKAVTIRLRQLQMKLCRKKIGGKDKNCPRYLSVLSKLPRQYKLSILSKNFKLSLQKYKTASATAMLILLNDIESETPTIFFTDLDHLKETFADHFCNNFFPLWGLHYLISANEIYTMTMAVMTTSTSRYFPFFEVWKQQVAPRLYPVFYSPHICLPRNCYLLERFAENYPLLRISCSLKNFSTIQNKVADIHEILDSLYFESRRRNSKKGISLDA